MRRLITAVVPLLLTFAAIGEAAGQTCTAPRAPLRPSESDWVRDHVSCSPYLFGVDGSHWQRVGFNRGSWTGPFAPGAVCDWETPYGRTMLTIEFLAYVQRTWEPRMAQNAAAGLTPRPAGLAAVDAINDLRADCQVKSKATTVNLGSLIHQSVTLHIPSFGLDIVNRAANLVHEARHIIDNKGHDGSRCHRRQSCDSSWAHDGANRWEFEFYAAVALNWNIDDRLRALAVEHFRNNLWQAFDTVPNFPSPFRDGSLSLPRRPLPPPVPEPLPPTEEPVPQPPPVDVPAEPPSDPCTRPPFCTLPE
jgi:hypothetical protein